MRRELVPDACQEVWLELWKARHRFRGESQLRTWAFKIARRRSLNMIRNERCRARIDASDALRCADAYAEVRYRDEPLLAAIRSACERLPRAQREVFLRHALLDESHEEIAAALGIAAVTSRAHLSKARATLRTLLSPYAPPTCSQLPCSSYAPHSASNSTPRNAA